MQVEWTRLRDAPSGEEAAMQLVAELAVRAFPTARAASVTLVRDGQAWTSGMSGPAGGIDDAQYTSGRGPCLAASGSSGPVNIAVTDEAARWPEFSAAAAGVGVASSLSVPLRVEDRAFGSLNVYAASLHAFGAEEEELAGLLARQAAVVVAATTAAGEGERMVAQLREALETRDIIGQAKGILMERESCTPEAAFDILRRASQRTNRKLRDVAADLVASRARRGRH
jgi:GAF domain-containing protein